MTHLPDRMEGSLPASNGECEEAGDFAANSMFDSGGEAFRITGPAEETDGLGEIAAPVGGTADSRAPGTSSLSRERPNPSGRRRAQVVVLLPALNEGPALGAVSDRIPGERVRARGYDVRVCGVDAQSTDATVDIAPARRVSTFVQSGTGNANRVRPGNPHAGAADALRPPHRRAEARAAPDRALDRVAAPHEASQPAVDGTPPNPAGRRPPGGDRVRVCLLTPEFLPTWGGVGTYTYNLARALRGRAEVHVVTSARGRMAA